MHLKKISNSSTWNRCFKSDPLPPPSTCDLFYRDGGGSHRRKNGRKWGPPAQGHCLDTQKLAAAPHASSVMCSFHNRPSCSRGFVWCVIEGATIIGNSVRDARFKNIFSRICNQIVTDEQQVNELHTAKKRFTAWILVDKSLVN